MTASHTPKLAALGFLSLLSVVSGAQAETPAQAPVAPPISIMPTPPQVQAAQTPVVQPASPTQPEAPKTPAAQPVSPAQAQASPTPTAAVPPQTPTPPAKTSEQSPAPVAPALAVEPVAAGTSATLSMTTSVPNSFSPPPVPVETAPLGDIKKDSIGLLATTDGGLGTDLWKDTSRAFVDQFMPLLNLPLAYQTLNNLAFRFLSTTASAPEGNATEGASVTLSSIRVSKLLALGHSEEAWKLATLSSADQIDDATLRHTAEAALAGPSAAEVCAKLPEYTKTHTGIEWQKLVAVCQLQVKDTKAAQITLDLMHTQGVHDEVFFDLAEKNVIGSSKILPRRLTPVQPLNLALVQVTGLPLRDEVYTRPPAAQVKALLKMKAENEALRIGLAERAATVGTISAKELEDVYRSQTYSADNLANATNGGQTGGPLRALLFQASQNESNAKNRIAMATKFLQSLDVDTKGGNMLPVLADVLGDAPASSEYYQVSAQVAQIYILANKKESALAWLDLTRNGARGMPQVASDLQNLWPLIAISGLDSKDDYDKNLKGWIAANLPPAEQKDADARTQKSFVGPALLLIDASGQPVSDEAWAKLADSSAVEKAAVPPVLVTELLRNQSAAGHKGATILLSLLAAASGKDGPSLMATVDAIRALRAVGLTAEAKNLAIDATLRHLTANSKL